MGRVEELTNLNTRAYGVGEAEAVVEGIGTVRIERHEPTGARCGRFERRYFLNGEKTTAAKLYRKARELDGVQS